ncbi:MAG: ABC transporter ATP-binding protein [Burkholderiales bacterium]|nr:ABC transporter ATP-binding protein [Burkholderiales bacterium]
MDKVRVEARHIEVSYGATKVLRDVSLIVEPGEFFALLGPSGSGKSTLLRLIAGFNRQQSGELLIGGREVSRLEPWKRNVGMVFQSYALWPHMTVAKNVAFGLEERRLPREEVRRKVEAALELVGLAGYGARLPGQLSGGQQQRVALARTLAIEPQVLLLDEPLSNLDARLRVQMRRELKRLHERLGITTLFVTHDQEEAMTICDRIAVLDQGVIQQIGTPVDLFDQPANRFVAQFVGSVNLFEAAIDRNAGRARLRSSELGDVAWPASLAVPPASHLEFAFRPHAVTFSPGAAPDDCLALDGTIESGEFLGEFVRYEVRVGSALVVADRPHARGGRLLKKGTAVRLAVPSHEIRIIT